MVPARAPEQKRGVLEGGTAKLYLLELDRTVILSNVSSQQPKRERSGCCTTGLAGVSFASEITESLEDTADSECR